MSLSENDKRVLRLIKVGAENSITGAEISLITKLSDTRRRKAPSGVDEQRPRKLQRNLEGGGRICLA